MPKSTDSADAAEANRWLPPSPHRERVLALIAAGRAHIEEQGHRKPPLLVHEDGGVLELPLVRIGSNGVVAESKPDVLTRLTKHSDVCGCIDDIEAWLKEDPAGPERDPERLNVLLGDAVYMCRRMARRLDAYREWSEQVAAVVEQMQGIAGPDTGGIDDHAERLRQQAAAGAGTTAKGMEEMVAGAEVIRELANELERTLRRHRDAATELGALFQLVKGARNWEGDVAERLSGLRGAMGERPVE